MSPSSKARTCPRTPNACLMSARPEKILAIQFKYLGDAVLLTPALRALRKQFPDAELHLLVPEEVAPVLQHLPWLNRVWPMPRRRGSASLRQTWPVVRALRRERFDRSVDFAGNDRGAILSLLIGKKTARLGRTRRFLWPPVLLQPTCRAGDQPGTRVGADDAPPFRVGRCARPARTGNPK